MPLVSTYSTRSLTIGIIASIPLSNAVPYRLQKRGPSSAITNLGNFPDPSIITVGGTYYAFGTNGAGGHIQTGASNNFGNPGSWSPLGDAMPNLASWIDGGSPNVWAPSVIQFVSPRLILLTGHKTHGLPLQGDYDNSYGIYYTASLAGDASTHCIGLARSSSSVTGPYSDGATYAFICPTGNFQCDNVNRGGAIDPASFRDKDGSWYIVYKEDGPSLCSGGVAGGYPVTSAMQCSHTRLMLQKVGNDGYSGVTCDNPPVALYDNAGASDKYNIEAPSIVLSSDGLTYFLFFSSGVYNDESYTVSYVTSTNGVAGPYGNRQTLLAQGSYGLNSPGGLQMQLVDALAVFHGDSAADNDNTRWMYTATINWNGQTCSIA